MNLPQTIDRRALALLAPTDTHAVRVIVRRVVNQSPFRVRGKLHHYLFEWDYELQAHLLDIPQSVWMREFPTGPYRDNGSIAHDLQGNRASTAAPLVFLLVPWAGQAVGANLCAGTPDFIKPLRELMEELDAPELVRHAFSLARGTDTTALQELVTNVKADRLTGQPEAPEVELAPITTTASEINPKTDLPYTPEALRMRAYRARKKAATA